MQHKTYQYRDGNEPAVSVSMRYQKLWNKTDTRNRESIIVAQSKLIAKKVKDGKSRIYCPALFQIQW